MLVWYQASVASPDAIHLTYNSPLLAFELQRQPFAFVFVALDLDVEPPPGKNARIGDAHIHFIWENLGGKEYLLEAVYPMPGRQIRLGVTWDFLN